MCAFNRTFQRGWGSYSQTSISTRFHIVLRDKRGRCGEVDQIGAKDIAMLLFSSSRRSKIELCICFKPFIMKAVAVPSSGVPGWRDGEKERYSHLSLATGSGGNVDESSNELSPLLCSSLGSLRLYTMQRISLHSSYDFLPNSLSCFSTLGV